MSKSTDNLQSFLASPRDFNIFNLSNKNLTDDDCVKIANVLKGNTTITELLLSQNQIGAQGAAALAEGLKMNSTITFVSLTTNQIGDQGAAALAEVFKVNKTITKLNLYQNQIGNQGAAALAEGFKVNNTITLLYLHHNQVGDQGAAALAQGFKDNKIITEVYLHHNQIGDQGATALAEVFKVNKSTTALRLEQNQIGDQGATALAEVFKVNKSITELHLQQNQIGDQGATSLAEVFKVNKSITHLNLYHNQIGDRGAAALAEGLKMNSTITHVILYQNQIGDQGAAALAEGFKVNKTITYVDFSRNQIRDQGGAALAESFKVNNTITFVNLPANQIGDQGAAALAESFKVNKTIVYVSLGQNQIGGQGAAALAEGFKVNKTITHLHLNHNQIGDQGAAALAQGFKDNKTIANVHLSQNQIGDQGLQLLKSSWQGDQSKLYLTQQKPEAGYPTNKGQDQADKFGHDYFFAAFNNDIGLAQKWLASAAPELSQPDNNGKTLLWHAAFFGREDIVRMLLEGGAQLNCFNNPDKAGHTVLEMPAILKNDTITNMIKVALLADRIYMGENFELQELDLSLGNAQSASNRHHFLARLRIDLLKNGIPEHYLAENYKIKLQAYLQNLLPDNFADDIIILLENLHLGRTKIVGEAQRVLKELLQSDSDVDLVKLLATKEEMVSLMINSGELSNVIHMLKGVILTGEEKKVVDALLQRYDNLTPEVQDLIRQNHPTIKDAADTLLKAVNLKEIKLTNNEQLQAEKGEIKTAKQKEKVKEYVPEIDINNAMIFPVEEQGDNENYNETIKQISELIREGNDRLQGGENKAILLLGNTGAGKSTLAHLLSGRKLQAIVDDETGELIIDAMQPLNDIIIGHKASSETKVPNRCHAANHVGNMVIWDCPGFNDTDVVQEIANSFYIKRLFETTKHLKFVLVISEHELKLKGALFVQTLASFTKVFSNIKAIEGSVSLVVTHVEPLKEAQHIKNLINNILKQNQQVTAEQKELISSILNKSFHLFHKPQNEGEMGTIDLFTPINQSSCYIFSNPNIASISVSEKAKACSSGLLSTAANNFNKILGTMAKAIADASNCLKTDPANNVFLQNYNIVKDWVPPSIHYKDVNNHNPAEYFLQLDHLSMLAKLLSSHNQITGIAEGINILRQAIEVFAGYTSDTQLKHQMQDYGYTLAQQYEYIRFFSEVCGRTLPDHLPLAKLIKECHNKVRENLEYQTKTLQLNETHNDPAYYHKAIEYLDYYQDSQLCKKLKAVAYCGLGNIAQHQGDNNRAIDCYYKAINTYKQLPEAYAKLGKLFFDKGEYGKAINCYKAINNEYEIKSCFKEWLKQTPKNPNIMLKQAEYFESVGSFEAARKYYGYAAGLSKDEEFKANALRKEANALSEHSKKLAAKAEELNLRAENEKFYNFDEIKLDEMEGYQLPIIGNNEAFGGIYH